MKKYSEQVFDARKYAMEQILTEFPKLKDISFLMDNFFTIISNRISEQPIVNDTLQYKILLCVSFMRTHFVINELILYSSNLEAATLLRKQIELLARMNELKIENIEKLQRKTPCVKHVPWVKKFYGILSESAHSATIESLDDLGYTMENEECKRFYIQPTYSGRTIDLLYLWIELFMMFSVEMIEIQSEIFENYDSSVDWNLILQLIKIGLDSNLDYFDGYKELDDILK